MAWDGKKLPDALASAATAAASAAASGAKSAAYLSYVRDQIGANFLMKLLREDVVVWQATASGSLTISGSQFVLPTTVTQTSISTADIDTGEWILRVENASDNTKYIATGVTKSDGPGPFRLTGDLASGGTVTLGALTLNSPVFDTVSLGGLTASGITSSSATLAVVVSGAVPAGSLMQIQVTLNPVTGPWIESNKPPAAVGTFSHTFAGLSPGATHYYRAFVYTEPGGGAPAIIHAQSETVTFVTTAAAGSLTTEYALAMTAQNDFLPSNLNSYGYIRPDGTRWGQDPVYFPAGTNGGAQQDYRVYGASSIFLADSQLLGLWPWIMPPYNVLNAPGNWRVQLRDAQWAFKLDSITNPWLTASSPQNGRWRPLSGLSPNPPTVDTPPVMNRVRVPWYDSATNGVEDSASQGNETLISAATNLSPRSEIGNGGGFSVKDLGTSLSGNFLKMETNIWVNLRAADAGFDPRRIKALAVTTWGRLIPDNPLQAWNPETLNVGLMIGCDVFGPSHVAGQRGIGLGRFVKLSPEWRPAVYAVIDQTAGGPYTPTAMGTWLSANPPPFV